MGVLDFVKRGVSELMLARPAESKGLLIYKHPEPTIPTRAQLTVDQDDVAIFMRDRKVVGVVGPGRHTLESANWPFLSDLIDRFTGGNVLLAEVYFVTVREVPNLKFGGRIGAVEDPKSGVPVETMVHGTYSLRVTDPQRLLLGLVGLKADNDDGFVAWFRELLLKVMRDRVAELLVKRKWPLLDVTSGAYTEEIEQEVIEAVKVHVDDYGLSIVRIGNFVVAISEDDATNLKRLYTDAAYVRMAGGLQGYQQFAAGRALIGAAEGMAQGGAVGAESSALLGGAGLGVGLAMASAMQGIMGGPTVGARPGSTPPPMAASGGGVTLSAEMAIYVHLGGQQQGPWTLETLRHAVQAGHVKADTPAWIAGMPAWAQAAEIPALAGLWAVPPLTPPPFPGG